VLGAIPVIGLFALTGLVCLGVHFQAASDTHAVHGVALAALVFAGISVLLSGQAIFRATAT
jgi:hypothetical protein